MTDALGIYREKRFSPGKVEEDAAILDRTAGRLRDAGFRVRMVEAEALGDVLESPRLVFAMCQSREALAVLDSFRCPVVNPPAGVRRCFRANLVERLGAARLPQPRWALAGERLPRELGPGPWLKRGDVHAMEPADVRRVFDEDEWREALDGLRRRGAPNAIAQEHREGSVYKFYGVAGGFFRAFGLPGDREPEAARLAAAAAGALALSVWGGDGVLARDGSLALVDFNDWPSFSRCREEASAAIAAHLVRILERTNGHDTDESPGAAGSRS